MQHHYNSRAQAWAGLTWEHQVQLLINEHEELEGRVDLIESGVKKRLDWIIGLLVTTSVGFSSVAAALLLGGR